MPWPPEDPDTWAMEARFCGSNKCEPKKETPRRGPSDDGFNNGRPDKDEYDSNNIYHLVD